ncbi:MAG TPA: MFS transporter [Actinomycetota bacterium]|nr:MFS transporter [Actinomycetota bacterium]
MDSSKAYARRWWTLVVLSLSLVVIGLDNTILNVALPTLVRELSATQSDLQWMIDSYVLIFAGLLLTMGSFGDRFGRKRALLIGLVIFGVASFGSSMATSATQLIAGRAVMGIGAALIMPSTLSIITTIFTGKELGKAIGIWAGVAGIGIVGGPVIGGWLLEHFWWGSVFLVNIPIVAVALALALWLIPESKDPKATPLDLVGAGLSIAALVTLVYGLIEAPQHGWTGDETLIALGIGFVLLAAFVFWEIRTPHPMLQMSFFRNRRFSVANFSITLTFFALFGSVFMMTQHLQFVLGFTPLEAGTRVMPVATMIISAPLSAKLAEKFGTKLIVALGLFTVAGAFLLFSTLEVTGYTRIGIGLAVLGFGMGLVMAPATESIMASVPLAKAGVGSAMNDTTREVGGALGVAVLGSVFSSAYATEVAPALGGLPAGLAGQARDSIGAATIIAGQLGGQAGQALAAASKIAFVDSLSSTLLIAAGIAAVGAVVTLLLLPSRGEAHEGAEEREREPLSPLLEAEMALDSVIGLPEPVVTRTAPPIRQAEPSAIQSALTQLPFQAGTGTVRGNLEDFGLVAMEHYGNGGGHPGAAAPDLRPLAGYLLLEQRFDRINSAIDPHHAAYMLVGAIAAKAKEEPGHRITDAGGDGDFLAEAVGILVDGIGLREVVPTP